MKRNHKKLLKFIGDRLKSSRLEKRWTLTKVAKKTGMSFSLLQKYESGVVNIPHVKFIDYCRALKIDAGALVNDAIKHVFTRR